jgi:hypothetical protein
MRVKTLAAAMCAAFTFGVQGTASADLWGPGPEDPAGCTAPVVTDWDGDAVVDQSGGQLGKPTHPGPDDMDLTSFNLTWAGDHLVADIGLKALSGKPMDLTDSQGGNDYYVFFKTADGVNRFVRATNRTQDGITFAYGEIARLSAGGQNLFDVYQTDGTTTGKLDTATGHITMDVPASVGIKPGDLLTDLTANADGIFGYDDQAGFNNHVDEAPDGSDSFTPSGVTLTVTDCLAPPA